MPPHCPQSLQLLLGSSSCSGTSWLCCSISALQGRDTAWRDRRTQHRGLKQRGRDPQAPPTCGSCAGPRRAHRAAAWRGAPAREGPWGWGPPTPEETHPAAPRRSYQLLEGEAAAVAQQRDEGSFAHRPVGTGTLSGAKAGALLPLCPLPTHSPGCQGVLAAPVLLRFLQDQRGLQCQLLLCKSRGTSVRLGSAWVPPTHPPPHPPHSPPSMSRAHRQSRQRCDSLLALAGSGLSFSPVLQPR